MFRHWFLLLLVGCTALIEESARPRMSEKSLIPSDMIGENRQVKEETRSIKYFRKLSRNNEKKDFSYVNDERLIIFNGNTIRIELPEFQLFNIFINDSAQQLPVDTINILQQEKQAFGTCERGLWKQQFKNIRKSFGETCDSFPNATITLPYDEYVPYTPIDWMKRFVNEDVTIQKEIIEFKGQDVEVVSLQYSNETFVFYVNAHYQVPVRVQVKKAGEVIKTIDYLSFHFT
ncbi:hypothetical protein HY486_04070 [Candidatus Woesearchaeota archaeon]|nr:hypothetical protein [Candidatus Woesearchaeota archaeon]